LIDSVDDVRVDTPFQAIDKAITAEVVLLLFPFHCHRQTEYRHTISLMHQNNENECLV
jgi:hypothetical protein